MSARTFMRLADSVQLLSLFKLAFLYDLHGVRISYVWREPGLVIA